MTPETFNALPLEARRYIEQQKSCASCGKSNDIDRHYKNYLAMKANRLYTLRIGAVVFKDEDGEGKVLYPLHPKDTKEDVKSKLALAVKVHAEITLSVLVITFGSPSPPSPAELSESLAITKMLLP